MDRLSTLLTFPILLVKGAASGSIEIWLFTEDQWVRVTVPNGLKTVILNSKSNQRLYTSKSFCMWNDLQFLH